MDHNSKSSVAVLLTCFNRVDKTVQCLHSVYEQAAGEQYKLDVYLVDDGSSDGTSESVRTMFPQVILLQGDGTLFWNRGMHKAFGVALEKSYDFYLWLNDDTHLYDGAIRILLNIYAELSSRGEVDSIVIPATRDPLTDKLSYGGYRRNLSVNKTSLSLVPYSEKLERCDTFCGNCVLIPSSVAQKVGNINYAYQHRWGDVDYGLRALEKGCKTWIAPGYLADCEANPLADRWRNSDLAVTERLQELHSLKGLGKNDWYQFVRRHGGVLWPIVWISPYIKILISTLINRPINEK